MSKSDMIGLHELTLSLMMWIASNSSYQIEQIPLPEVVPMSAIELTQEFYRGYPDQIPADGIDERIKALYNIEASSVGSIYLLAPSDGKALDDPLFGERLLHELVHHIQRHSGRWEQWPCRAVGEREAYQLGGRWLKQQNVDDPMPNRRFWAAMYSRC